MFRKAKAVASGAIALVALGVLASAASAIEFHSTSAHTILSGEQTTSHKFTVGSGFGAITCTTAKFSGTTTKTTESSIIITPEYKGCKDSFGRTVHHTVESKHRYTPPITVTGEANTHFEGRTTLQTTNGTGTPVCDVKIETQTNNGIVYHDVASGVETTLVSSNIKTTTSGGSLNCGVSDGAHTGGSYTGTILMKGTDTEGKAVTFSVS